MSDIGGVWRTVGGRRIFIKDGEDLETAMKKSGKFQKMVNRDIKMLSKLDDDENEFEKLENAQWKKFLEETDDTDIKELYKERDNYNSQKAKNIVEEYNKRFGEKEFEPKAVGSKKFSDYGLKMETNQEAKEFSNYLREKYGTDDLRISAYDNKEKAQKIYNDFKNEKAYKEYVQNNLNNDDYLRENNPNAYFYKMTEQSNKLHTRAVDGVRNDVKTFLSGKVDYDGGREDFINDLANEWNVSKTIVGDILYEESKKHPRLFKPDRKK